jgi:hypothetical protein
MNFAVTECRKSRTGEAVFPTRLTAFRHGWLYVPASADKKLTTDTKVKAKPALKVQEIKPGTRIVVSAVEEKDKSLTAKIIEVGAASPPPPSSGSATHRRCR